MALAGFGRSHLPFDMFDFERTAEEARRAEKLSSLYHRGQDLAWDGRAVLAELLAKHGGVRLPEAQREALSHVFAVILWGELAAWKVSAQLADRLESLEAKMAATSQAHDEARHFYVMVDYMRHIGYAPSRIDRSARAILDMVLETDDLCSKLLGMQLQVETLALTIFQVVREAGLEPVLGDLLRYYEKDEARHVGLGIQYLPNLMKGISRIHGLRLLAFQVKLVGFVMVELRMLEPDLRTLGIDPLYVLSLGRAKQMLAYEMLWAHVGGTPASRKWISQFLAGIGEFCFVEPEIRADFRTRTRRAWQVMRHGGDPMSTTL